MSDGGPVIASPELRGGTVTAVRVGGAAPLGPQGVPSAYRKAAVALPVRVGELGLVGDAQADLRVHGGADKAIYAYAVSRYLAWSYAFPGLSALFVAGAMGENLPVEGVDENSVHIGDRVRVGGALLQITQPRQPCFKIELALGAPGLVRHMVRSGHSGWYFRVLEAGMIGAGDDHRVIERPNPGWPVARFNTVIAARALGADVLAEMVAMEGLAAAWQVKALRLLAELRGVVP